MYRTHSCTLSLVNKAAGVMEDDLMFSMEEVEGSAKRPPLQSSASIQTTSSISDDEDDTDHGFICPILDENSAKDICHYLKNLVNDCQLSNSLPKSSFTYQVGDHCTQCENSGEPWPVFDGWLSCCILQRPALFCENSCLPYKENYADSTARCVNTAQISACAVVVSYLLTV